MKETYLFAKRFLSKPQAVGSLFPSSEKLGLCIAAQFFQQQTPKRYLEVGGGSGALTSQLVQKITPPHWLDIVEKDPKFCFMLRKKFQHLPNVTIHESSILEFQSEPYDQLISSLPLNAFSSKMVNGIFRKYECLIKKGGKLTYFEYLGIEKLKKVFLFGKKWADFQHTLFLKKDFVFKYGGQVEKIWWNFPPARVIHCQF
jgi:phosphatidylethanolamine/phosphatidyl-N-methylethanolamine N-methyltransferase